ncbi:unnamed protein product [Timema podura]|uniref:Cytochrome P450 n=1 Tax=Timema podura TaxID=61482 RepID=A0ABN7PNZ0_TIMPD|nr:unnamed protein product [Timema podura]
MKIMMNRVLNPWFMLDTLFKFTTESKELEAHYDNICSLAKQIISDRRSIMRARSNDNKLDDSYNEEDSNGKRDAVFIDRLLELEDEGFTEEDIIYEVNTFLIAVSNNTLLYSFA